MRVFKDMFILAISFLFIGLSFVNSSVRDPIRVKLSMPVFPALNEQVEIICSVDCDWDLPNVNAEIKLPSGATFVSGVLSWQGDLKKGNPAAFSAKIIFTKEGNWEIKAVAKSTVDERNSWSSVDYLLLNVDPIKGQKGFIFSEHVNRIKAIVEVPLDAVPIAELKEALLNPWPFGVPEEPPSVEPNQALEDFNLTKAVGNLTINGRWGFYDRGGNWVGACQFIVELLKGSGSHLDWAYTDCNGYFTFPSESNPGSAGIKVRILTYVKYAPNGYDLIVVHSGGDSRDNAYYCETGTYVFSDGTYDMGTITVTSPAVDYRAKSFWIKDDLDRGFKYPLLYFPSWQPGGCIVEWPDDDDQCFENLFVIACYYPGEHVHLRIWSADDTRDVVLHEMAHNIMYNVYGGDIPPDDCPEEGYSYAWVSGPSCAWEEGWADFYPLAVKNSPYYILPGGGSNNWDSVCFSGGCDPGDQVIYHVGGALWDLKDNINDGYDTYSFDFYPIWDVVYNQNANTFSEFWSAWVLRGHDNCHGTPCLYQNTIDYNAKPFFWFWPFNIPDKELCENEKQDNSIDIWNYAYDAECPDDELIFTIEGNTDPNCGVTLDGNRYIDINPMYNWANVSEVTVKVFDGMEWDTDVFKITVEEASVTLSSPNGGENWSSGCNYNITWDSHCILGDVKIEYSTDSGNDWDTVVLNTPNDGIYSWKVPVTVSSNCLIKLSDLDGDPYDISNANFTIQSLRAPKGTYTNKNRVCINEAYAISWYQTPGATSYDLCENGNCTDVGNVTSKEYYKSSAGNYTYKVIAKNDCWISAENDPITVKVISVPAKVTDLRQKINPFGCPPNSVRVYWRDVNDEELYKIYCSYEDTPLLCEIVPANATSLIFWFTRLATANETKSPFGERIVPVKIYSLEKSPYKFWIIAENKCGTSSVSDTLFYLSSLISPNQENQEKPTQFSLSQNCPNPFNSITKIEFSIPDASYVRLDIYDILGRRVRTLVDEYMSEGYKSVTWDGKDDKGNETSTGVYFCKINAGKFTQTIKMGLVK
jgi:hypothetical protein